ncbi:MAG: MBL fold metallo-hydrolase [Candidatus Bathyarchaeota archaeon]|nr:MAG: MBL fold metallo-hydrolase [Candidatus Bathyarchaeota archaeon]
MIFERVKSEGIAHISYFIGSNSEAVVIDPRRDCQVYIDLARREEMKIKYIFETHRNEDYVIGSLELAHFTGAKIYHGPGLDFKYGERLKDGQEFHFGILKLIAVHTPGHTDESVSYALADLTVGEEPIMVFTGDALFVGDVGRTDLYGHKEATRLAGNLYDSIFNKLLPLGDKVILCPAHGAGSVCGGPISEREQSTLGLERIQNPVLQKTKREDFIQFKITEHHERPPYFRKMEQYNLNGPPLLGHLPNPTPLTPKEFQEQMQLGAVAVDIRMPPAFGGAHIKGSYSIWLDGLPSLAGWMLPYDKPILLMLEDEEQLERAIRYLVRLGYNEIACYLGGGIEAWYNEALPIKHISLLTVQDLKKRLDRGDDLLTLDVRRKDEWDNGHIEGALHIYVGHLEDRLREVSVDRPIAVICNVGHRASLGASILRREGYQEVYNVLGGMTAWKNAGYTIVR